MRGVSSRVISASSGSGITPAYAGRIVQYTFEPITSLASLGENNLPFRAGQYRVTVTYSLRLRDRSASGSGKVTAVLTIRPSRLVFGGVEVESRMYDATTDAEYNLENMYLVGVFGDDDVLVNIENATARFWSPDATPEARVIINGVALAGADMHNYYLAPVDSGAAITPRPLHLYIEVDSRIYDGTKGATITSNPDLSGVLAGDDVRIDPDIYASFAQATVGINIPVEIPQGALIGEHAHNYYIASIEGFGNIYPRPLTVMPTIQDTRVYDATTALTVDAARLVNKIPGDDVRIVSLDVGELSSPDVGDREVIFNFQIDGDDASNYTLIQPQDITVEITPKPITVDVEIDGTITMSNEATILSTSLSTILPRDVGYVSLYSGRFALFSPRAYLPPPNERFVNVHFHDFKLVGDRAFNYKLISPEDKHKELDRFNLPGAVRIENRDNRLRIGSELYFTHDIQFFSPSLWERVWFVGGRNPENIVSRGFGADTMDLDIVHQYVDQRVYLQLVSINDRYEVWAINPTDYVPFTIVVDIDQRGYGNIMGTDDVFMNNASDRGALRRQTYSASHGRHIDIEFNLWGLANGRSSIYFNHPNIANTRNSATAIRSNARYNINPADAVDGVITINTTFVHRGVNLGVANHTFPAVNCGFTPPSHALTVTNIGNAPTNPITVSRTNPTQYNISTATIASIPIGGSASVSVSPVAGQFANTPGTTESATGARTITSTVTVAGNDIAARTATYSMTINHSLPAWSGQHGTASHCQRRCTHAACNALHQLTHALPEWTTAHALNNNVSDSGRCGTRACTRCGNNNTANSHRNHAWGGWGTWGHGDGTNHHRSRSCGHGGCSGAQNSGNFAQHNNAGVRAAHNEASVGGWVTHTSQSCTQGGSYSRGRSCSTCGRFMRTEWSSSDALGHSMGGWSQTSAATCTAAGTQTRNCTRCGGNTETQSSPDALGHSFGSWGPGVSTRCTGITFTQSRTCSRAGCSASETRGATGTAAHNMGLAGSAGLNHGCLFTCSNCTHFTTQPHNWIHDVVVCGNSSCQAGTWRCTTCGEGQSRGGCLAG